ncbi:hypothetical protein VW41_14075 [Klebsiella michiganensis]|nr:hypothetical protein VW41_14075 [Klebsiella michiganensis]
MKKSKEQIILELNNYLHYGYTNADSYDDSRDEVAILLTSLHFIDPQECEIFCKKIIGSKENSDDYLDSSCLSHLFDLNKEYALQYVEQHITNMSTPILDETMDGFIKYSKTSFRMKFSDDLISKVYTRYKEISADPFYAEMLEATYRFFSEEYPENNANSQR